MLRREFLKTSLFAGLALALGGNALEAAAETAGGNAPKVRLGIDVLEAEGFRRLRGKRVGLLTNQAGVNSRGESTIRVLHTRGRRAGVKLAKLFGPEHGIYGNVPAEKIVQNQTDPATGLPVFSLYGKTRRPTPEMLSGLDVMVVDLQDVGSRSYTYVSCMRLVLEACFDAGVPVLVLDRPNPLGGLKTDGPMLDAKWQSYVGMYPVPYVHGLTIGELALAATRENWLSLTPAARSRGRVDVVKMSGWRRAMRWRDTGLKWVPTSPYISSPEAAEGYAMSGLGSQVGKFSHTFRAADGALTFPFRWISYPGKTDKTLVATINAWFIRGLTALPRKIGEKDGAYLAVANWDALAPCEISFHMMRQVCVWSGSNPFAKLAVNERDLFIKHVGSEAFFKALAREGAKLDVRAWCGLWRRQAQVFAERMRRHRLYD